MLKRRLPFNLVIPLAVVLAVRCGEAPTAPSLLPQTPAQPTANSTGLEPRTVALGEVIEIALDATVRTGAWYCDFGNDPAPCAWFAVDVPRAGTLVIRMEFASAYGMFVELPVHELFTSDRSPLIARKAVARGVVNFTAGLAVPWGLRDGETVRFSLVASLE